MLTRSRVAALVVLLLLAVVINAPARLLAFLVPAEAVALSGFSGSLWRGSASRCLLLLPGGYLHLGALNWSLQPFSLLLFSPTLSIDSAWGPQRISGDITLRGAAEVELSEFEGNISAAVVRQFLPVALNGELSTRIEHLRLEEGLPQEAEGQLVWQRAAWMSPQGQQALGSYALDFTQQAESPLEGRVLTLQGPVNAEGSVQLSGRAYTVQVDITTDAGVMDPGLQRALSLMARPIENGYELLLEGRL